VSALFAPLVRVLAFVGKELIETIRRPGALVSLILGPFLIMALFGLGYSGVRRPLDAIVVLPPDSGITTDPAQLRDIAGGGINVVGVTSDETAAMASLRAGTIDAVVVAPDHAQDRFRNGEQSVVDVRVNLLDPVAAGYASVLADALASRINQEITRRAVAEGEQAMGPGQPAANQIPPDVAAAPTRAALTNIAPSTPAVTSFFGPACRWCGTACRGCSRCSGSRPCPPSR
jgi:ABC-2 type transport system permease protein